MKRSLRIGARPALRFQALGLISVTRGELLEGDGDTTQRSPRSDHAGSGGVR